MSIIIFANLTDTDLRELHDHLFRTYSNSDCTSSEYPDWDLLEASALELNRRGLYF